MPCVFGSRILLGLRHQLLTQQINPGVPSVGTIQFGGAEGTTHTVIGPVSCDSGDVELQNTSLVPTHFPGSAQGEIVEKDMRVSVHLVDVRGINDTPV